MSSAYGIASGKNSATTCFNLLSFISRSANLTPSPYNLAAMATPRPDAAPVIIATWPLNIFYLVLFKFGCCYFLFDYVSRIPQSKSTNFIAELFKGIMPHLGFFWGVFVKTVTIQDPFSPGLHDIINQFRNFSFVRKRWTKVLHYCVICWHTGQIHPPEQADQRHPISCIIPAR